MEDSDKTFEKYFTGRMSSAQATDFSATLEANSELRERYELFLALKKSTSLIDRDRMRAELEEVVIEDLSEKEKHASANIFSIVKWVGSIAALFLISFIAYNAFQPSSNQELFKDNYKTYNVQEARGGEVDELTSLYKQGSYELFLEQAEGSVDSPELFMMVSNAHMMEGHYTKAISTLSEISDESSLRDIKYWYLGLCNLVVDNEEEAIKNFDHLLNISNFRKQEIEEILSAIK